MKILIILLLVMVGWFFMGILTCYIGKLIKKPTETLETLIFWPLFVIFICVYYLFHVLRFMAGVCGLETQSITDFIDGMYGQGE